MSRLAHLTPPTAGRRNGYPKATLRAALVNSGWLLTSSGLVIAGAIDRLTAGTGAAQALPILVVSGIVAAVMLTGALILGGDIDEPDDDDDDGDLNVRPSCSTPRPTPGWPSPAGSSSPPVACTGSARPSPSPSPPSSPTTPHGCYAE